MASETDGEHAELIDPIVETSGELIDMTRKARTIERVVDREAASIEFATDDGGTRVSVRVPT